MGRLPNAKRTAAVDRPQAGGYTILQHALAKSPDSDQTSRNHAVWLEKSASASTSCMSARSVMSASFAPAAHAHCSTSLRWPSHLIAWLTLLMPTLEHPTPPSRWSYPERSLLNSVNDRGHVTVHWQIPLKTLYSRWRLPTKHT